MPNIDQVQLPDGSQYNLKDNISGFVTAGYVDNVIAGLTKDNVGLGNVDNTSDLNKPVSTAQQTALNGKTNTTVIAPTEATTTASRRYEIGDQFILSGVLYTATAVIASGDTIIVNTNCALSESITEQIANVDLSALANKSDLTSISESGTTASQAISAGTYFYLNGTLVRAKTAIASGATFTLNTNYEVVTAGALNEGFIYSTDEHVVGKWIDGSILYEKTVDCGELPNNTTKSVSHSISNLGKIIDIACIQYNGLNTEWGTVPDVNISSLSNQLRVSVNTTKINLQTGGNYSGYYAYCTLKYTKTS